MIENNISREVVDTCFKVHTGLGPGLFESVYEQVLFHELTEKGYYVTKQQAIPVMWKGLKMEQGFRADIIVENKVLVEIKSVEALANVHYKQVLTYLKLTNIKLGLLINFNEALIKHGIKRIVNRL